MKFYEKWCSRNVYTERIYSKGLSYRNWERKIHAPSERNQKQRNKLQAIIGTLIFMIVMPDETTPQRFRSVAEWQAVVAFAAVLIVLAAPPVVVAAVLIGVAVDVVG